MDSSISAPASARSTKPEKQQGIALVFTLVFLGLIITTGLAAIQFASFQQKMTANFQNHQEAFIAAEEALRAAEKCLKDSTTCSDVSNYSATCTNGLCFNGSNSGSIPLCRVSNSPSWLTAALWRDTSRTRATTPTSTGSSARYIIEFLCYVPKSLLGARPNPAIPTEWSKHYRITSLADVNNANSRVMLQSTYKL